MGMRDFPSEVDLVFYILLTNQFYIFSCMSLAFNCSAERGGRVKSREQEQNFCSTLLQNSVFLQQVIALFFFPLLFERISVNNICAYTWFKLLDMGYGKIQLPHLCRIAT